MTLISTDIISSMNNDALELHYMCKTRHVTFSIADFGGNVMKRGNYDCIKNNTLYITDLPKGTYTLCIIDGDQLCKTRFQKD